MREEPESFTMYPTFVTLVETNRLALKYDINKASGPSQHHLLRHYLED